MAHIASVPPRHDRCPTVPRRMRLASSHDSCDGDRMTLRVAAAALALWTIVAAPAPARADNRAVAESEFLRGRQLMSEKKVAEACDAFARSQHLDPQFGTQFNLAQCWEQLGKVASAWAAYRELAQRDRH